jgi:hypothetical protein
VNALLAFRLKRIEFDLEVAQRRVNDVLHEGNVEYLFRSPLFRHCPPTLAAPRVQETYLMSDVTVLLHEAAAAAMGIVADLKGKIVALEPAIAADFAGVVSGAETLANNLTAQAATALQAEAAAIPTFGPAVAAALALAEPTIVADLKADYAKLGAFLDTLEQKAVSAVLAKA